MIDIRGITANVYAKREIALGERFLVEVEMQNAEEIDSLMVLFNQENENPSICIQMEKTKENNNTSKYSATLQFSRLGNYYFFFVLETKGMKKAIKLNRDTGKACVLNPNQEAPYWRVLVTQPNFEIPEWGADQIAYQIVVDRFSKGKTALNKQPGRNYRNWGEMPNWHKNEQGEFHNNDFFGGNIQGIEEKIEYLKSLSVGIIYLSPIMESLYRYERYASTNHMKIDLDAGTFQDLQNLHEKANQEEMYLVLDVAFNHCSSDNPIFQDALCSKNSPYRNWFYIDDNGNYRCWYGIFRDMPVFNQDNPEFQKYIYGKNGVVEKFAPYVDGFRLDVAEELKPFFLEGIRNKANELKKHLIIGECWDKVPINLLGKGMDCPTNYLFTNAILKFVVNGENEYLEWQINDILENYPQNTIDTMLNSLDTHDMMRAITILSKRFIRGGADRIWDIDKDPSRWHVMTSEGRKFLTEEFRTFEFSNDRLGETEYQNAVRLLKVAVILQYFLPGNPCIFYGTEVGLHGFKDPFNRKCYPWGKEDKDLLKFYQDIGKFRKMYKGKESLFKVIYSDDEIFVFERENAENVAFVAVNRSKHTRAIDIPEKFKQEGLQTFSLNVNDNYLLPYGGIIILK